MNADAGDPCWPISLALWEFSKSDRATQVGCGRGVVKSLGGSVFGPVGFIREQKFQFFKNEKPTSVVESYKTTYRHKADISGLDVRC